MPDIDASSILKDAFSRCGFTVREWAEAAGVGRATLAAIMSGRIPSPGIHTLEKAVKPSGLPLWIYVRAQEEERSIESFSARDIGPQGRSGRLRG